MYENTGRDADPKLGQQPLLEWPSIVWIWQLPRDIDPMMFWCWSAVSDVGQTSRQHWVSVSCLLGRLMRHYYYTFRLCSANTGWSRRSPDVELQIGLTPRVRTYQYMYPHSTLVLLGLFYETQWPRPNWLIQWSMGEGSYITLFSPIDVNVLHRMKYGGGGVLYNLVFTEWPPCVSQNFPA